MSQAKVDIQNFELRFDKAGYLQKGMRKKLLTLGYNYCASCKQILPEDEFYIGKIFYCKKCSVEMLNSRRANGLVNKTMIIYQDRDRAKEYNKIISTYPEKECSVCNEKKDARHFYLAPSYDDGLFPVCRKCLDERRDCLEGFSRDVKSHFCSP